MRRSHGDLTTDCINEINLVDVHNATQLILCLYGGSFLEYKQQIHGKTMSIRDNLIVMTIPLAKSTVAVNRIRGLWIRKRWQYGTCFCMDTVLIPVQSSYFAIHSLRISLTCNPQEYAKAGCLSLETMMSDCSCF